MTFPLMQQVCDAIVLASEDSLRRAIAGLARDEHLIAEGAGAATTAAIVDGLVPVDHGPLVAIVSGGNIDAEKLRGLIGG
jgi:threonine dehydratase